MVVPSTSDDEFGALTDAFNLMAGRVREMVRARDQLLLDVSHELRSPLTRMKVALEMMPDERPAQRPVSRRGRDGDDDHRAARAGAAAHGRGDETVRQDLVAIVREVVARYGDRPPGVRLAREAPPSGPPRSIASRSGA